MVEYSTNLQVKISTKDNLLDPSHTEGPIKSPLSACPSVCPSVSSTFVSGMAH